MNAHLARVAPLFALTSVLACSSNDELVVVTYNTGLSELFVSQTAQRAPLIADAVQNLDADVLCLQEVWSTEHVDAIRAASPHLPHAIVIEPKQEMVAGSCDSDGLQPLAECVAQACSDPPAADCILGNCGAEFDAQEGDCGICLATNLGSTLDEIQSACTTETGRYPYDGSYGLMLLSALPFASEEHIELDSALSRRAVIHAQLESGTDIFCTHLTALEDIPYPAEEGSWDEDQQRQMHTLARYIEDEGTGTTVLVLGDLNVGPDEAPDRFQQLLNAGFSGALDEGCTFCSGNPLVDDSASSVVIDHVLSRGAKSTAERIFEQAITIDGVTSALSDHYGVSATIQLGE